MIIKFLDAGFIKDIYDGEISVETTIDIASSHPNATREHFTNKYRINDLILSKGRYDCRHDLLVYNCTIYQNARNRSGKRNSMRIVKDETKMSYFIPSAMMLVKTNAGVDWSKAKYIGTLGLDHTDLCGFYPSTEGSVYTERRNNYIKLKREEEGFETSANNQTFAHKKDKSFYGCAPDEGLYPVYGIKNDKDEYIALKIVFIEKITKDEEEEDYDALR